MEPSAVTQGGRFNPERIAQLTGLLAVKVNKTIREIAKINDRTRLLSFNAQIEAARAGGATGAAFGVVASAIRDLSEKTSDVSGKMSEETRDAIDELERISKILATHVRGTRLTDLALTNIDLIDRNLYERSCDVRWWATDSSPINALTQKTPQAYQHCGQRLGVILKSYTVYLDLVLCDLDGKVVANGRPETYRSVGANCRDEAWFQQALATRSGEEFGFQSLHQSPLTDGQRVLVYSCCVRSEGDGQNKPLGVLGILFGWDALAQTIMHDTPLSPEEQEKTRVCIVDEAGLILADSRNRLLQETLDLPDRALVFAEKKGFTLGTYEGAACCVAHARSPGYETYATGWHSLLIQKLNT